MIALRKQKGVTLVELMIALVLGVVLMLGLLEVFASAKQTYRVSEALARVQESGRFATDFLQRDLRMAGHMGCLNDQARALNNPSTYSTTFVPGSQRMAGVLDATGNPQLNFHRPVVGYEASGSGPANRITFPVTGAWTGAPALEPYISTLTPQPAAGSDIISLRYFSPNGIPADFNPTASASTSTITVDKASWDANIATSGYTNPGLLALSDCVNAVTFQASSVAVSGTNVVITVQSSGLNASNLTADAFTAGQTMLYRADSSVWYVALNDAAQPGLSLYRARYTAAPGAAAVELLGGAPDEMVAGVDSIQAMYGVDSETNTAIAPTGYMATQSVASAATVWPRVGLIRLGVLVRSAETTPVQPDDASLRVIGTRFEIPDTDQRLRSTYETTIAMRNRLFGN